MSGQIHTPVGATTEHARSLRELGPPNAVLVSGTVHDVVAREADAEAYPVVGAGAVFLIHRLVGDRAGVLSATGSHGPFVGRELEMSLLAERLRRLQSGDGHAVAICGESGIGKSRLLDEFAARTVTAGITTLRVNCTPQTAASPFFALKRLLRRIAGVADHAPADALLQRLEHAWPGSAEAWLSKRALLAELLGENRDDAAIGPLSPAERRAGIFAALHGLLAASAEHPRLLIIEDAHWIDPSSEAWLVELVERIAGQRLLLIVSHRPNHQPPWLDRPAVTKITLEGLAPEDSGRLVRALLAGRRHLPPRLGERLVERSGGNPFFLEQLVQALGPDADSATIPATVQAALAARIDQLAPEEKRLLQIASVIGPHASLELVARVDHLQESERAEALRSLQRHDLAFQRDAHGSPTLAFKHALTRDVAYGSLLRRTRIAFHGRVGLALEEIPSAVADRPELLAHHFAAAGDIGKAVGYFHQAGRQALARSAAREAIAHLEQALAALDAAPDNEVERQILLDLGVALQDVHGPGSSEVATIYARAQQLTGSAPASRDHFAALWNLWRNAIAREAYGASQPLAQQMLAIADGADDDELRFHAHHASWMAGWLTGALDSAIHHARAGIRLGAVVPHAGQVYSFGGHDPIVCGHGTLAQVHTLAGDAAAAAHHLAAGLSVAEEIGHAETLLLLLYNAIDIGFLNRDGPALDAAIARIAALAKTHEFALAPLVIAFATSWDRHRRGEREGIAGMEKALEAMRPRAPVGRAQFYVAIFAEVLVEGGLSTRAIPLLEKTLCDIGKDGAGHWAKSALLRVLGRALADAPGADPAKATRRLEEALEVAADQGAQGLVARAEATLRTVRQPLR